MPELAAPAASARSVVLAYAGEPAVGTSTFTIPSGSLTAVIGANGSGKSTLLNALTGLLEPVQGTIEVLGTTPERARDRVAYVLQSTKVNEVMPVTVREAVAMGRYARLGPFGRFQTPDRDAVATALERMAITDLAARHLTELSGGQRQRVFVAQGLVQEAEFLLLDEPITGLDLVSRDRIIAAVQDELAAGRTVAFTTHDLADANEADHVLLMGGKVIAEGPPGDVLTPDLLSTAYGIGILHLDDHTVVLADAAHRTLHRHVHFERGGAAPDAAPPGER